MALPLGVCMIPVMILGLSSVLQGQSVIGYLYFGFPAGLSVAAAWTYIRIRDVLVEMHFRDGDVGIRSLVSAASPSGKIRWFRLLDMQSDGNQIRLTLGHEFYKIFLSEWPEKQDLIEHLREALGDMKQQLDD